VKILVVEAGHTPYEKEISSEGEMTAVVEGPIEAIYPFCESVAVICNGESRNMQLPFNRSVPNGYGNIYGTFFVCGLSNSGMGFCSLKPEQIKHYKNYFGQTKAMVKSEETQPISSVISLSAMRKVTSPPRPKKRRGDYHER
jgi:hypothetical protein